MQEIIVHLFCHEVVNGVLAAYETSPPFFRKDPALASEVPSYLVCIVTGLCVAIGALLCDPSQWRPSPL